MQVEKEKPKQKPQQFKLLQPLHLLWILPLCFFLFMCSMYSIVAWDNIYGAGIEFMNRYPNSNLIWSGTRAGLTGDYGTQTYILWTADDISLVQAHYQKLSEDEQWFIRIFPVQGLDTESFGACTSFWEYDRRRDISYNECFDALKTMLPSYGTVIVFSYSIWVG